MFSWYLRNVEGLVSFFAGFIFCRWMHFTWWFSWKKCQILCLQSLAILIYYETCASYDCTHCSSHIRNSRHWEVIFFSICLVSSDTYSIVGGLHCYLTTRRAPVTSWILMTLIIQHKQEQLYTILFVSPTKKRIGSFSSSCLITYVMPPWKGMLYSCAASEFDEKFKKWGESIHHVLNFLKLTMKRSCNHFLGAKVW